MSLIVLIPVYNRKEMLKDCLDSLEKQTYKDFFINILDDGSTENLKEVIHHHNLKNIIVYNYMMKKNTIGEVRQLMLDKVLRDYNVDYLCWQDSDDLSEPTRLEKQVEYLNNNPDKKFVMTGLKRYDKNIIKLQALVDVDVSKYDVDSKTPFRGCKAPFATAMFRNEIAKEFKFEKMKTGEDRDWMRKIYYKYPNSFGAINEYLYIIREHEERLSIEKRYSKEEK